jgi:hypothetical protein
MNGRRMQRFVEHPAGGGKPAMRRLGDALDRLARGLRRAEQFEQLLHQSLHRVPARVAQNTGATPARYQALVNALVLPDRPMPLTRFERAIPGEAALTERMARLAAETVIANYCAMTASDAFVNAMRDQHAKSHGCVKAEFIVRSDLPAEFTTRLFRPGARYPAIVRFSNGSGKLQSDRKIDARGISIKLHGVDAPSFLHTLAPDRTGPGEHDFALSSFPVFFCKDVVDYAELMEAVSAPHRSLAEWRRWLAGWAAFIVRRPRQFFTLLGVGLASWATIRNPLTATYHSMSPYLFGEDKVVRYIVGPAQPQSAFARWQSLFSWPRSENFLQDALARDLNLAPHRPGEDFALEFSVRLRHAASPDDAEDASRWWNAPQDRIVRLARIEIPRQNFLEPDRRFDCQHMMINPWNCLPEHRPLGSINRMRLAVYLASLQARQKMNMVTP